MLTGVFVDFPLPDSSVSWPFLTGLVYLAHGPNLWEQATGLWGLLKATLTYKAVDAI